MKAFKIFFFLFLLSSAKGFSQYNNGGYGYGQKNYGVNRDIGRIYRDPQKATPEEIEKNRVERIDKFMAKLKADLSLDELQFIAIRNEVLSNSKNIDIVLKKETSEEEKSKEVKAMMEKSEATINSYLNKEQKEKYKVFVEELTSGKKDKKKKKDSEASQDKPVGE